MSAAITFEVLGTPMPQGSKKAFNANGRAMMKEAGGLRHAAWRNAVADKANTLATEHGPFTTAIDVEVSFRFPMPKSRTKAQHTEGIIAKTTAPDIDKLLRAVFDGLMAGGLISDDSLITSVTSCKYEVVEWFGAVITIEEN